MSIFTQTPADSHSRRSRRLDFAGLPVEPTDDELTYDRGHPPVLQTDRRVSQFFRPDHHEQDRRSEPRLETVEPDEAHWQLLIAKHLTSGLGDLQWAEIPAAEPIVDTISEALQAASPTPEGEDEMAAAAHRLEIRQTARSMLDTLLEGLGGVITTEVVTPLASAIFAEASDLINEASCNEYERYVDVIGVLNKMAAAANRGPDNTAVTFSRAELFEQDRYERFHLLLEDILTHVDKTRANIQQFKKIEEACATSVSSSANEALGHLHDQEEVSSEQLDAVFRVLEREGRDTNKERLDKTQAEIKALKSVLDGLLESIIHAVAKHYPAPDADWTKRGGREDRIIKDYRLDKKLDLLGDPDPNVGDKWMTYNTLFCIVNSTTTFTVLPGLVRSCKQRSVTNVHWQPPSTAEWNKRVTATTPKFHVSRLTHSREYYLSQNMSLWIKVAAGHDDVCARATSGSISTYVGGRDIVSEVPEHDFVSMYSYYIQYHMQQAMSKMHLLAQFYYSMGDGFRAAKDISSEVVNLRKKLPESIRTGVKLQYNGWAPPAYFVLADRHPSFVDLLRDFRECPNDVDPNDSILCIDKFLRCVEKGSRSLRDIRPPDMANRDTRRAEQRYRALLLDVIPALAIDAPEESEDTTDSPASGDFKCMCQAAGCKNEVSWADVKKCRCDRLVKKKIQPKGILCRDCVDIMHNKGRIGMEDGTTRRSSSKAGRRTLAALGLIESEFVPPAQASPPKPDDDTASSLGSSNTSESGAPQTALGVVNTEAGQFVPLETVLQLREHLLRGTIPSSAAAQAASGMHVLTDSEINQLMFGDSG